MNKDEKFLKSMKKQGLKKVCVWIPKGDSEEIKNHAALLRNKHRAK